MKYSSIESLRFPIKLALVVGICVPVMGQQTDSIPAVPVQELHEVILEARVLLGSTFQAKNRTGSAHYVSTEDLGLFNYADIHRTLRNIPGVNLYEEDGFGLRPNISLRGTSPERSAKITLMEDGVLIAPAPYSAPAAYYFPNISRMQAVEVLKGSSQIQYGPFTTGGALNLLSASIPNRYSGYFRSQFGSYGSQLWHFRVGNQAGRLGYLVEFLKNKSDGFKVLENGGNTGFDQSDILAKLSWNLNPHNTNKIELKFQYSEEQSNETYLGLTADDFKNHPFMRYSASAKDGMEADHLQLMLTHTLQFTPGLRLTSTAYQNHFNRNWYKLNDISRNGLRIGLPQILDAPDHYPEYYAILRGQRSGPDDALSLKANNRTYSALGLQTKLDWKQYTEAGNLHGLELGFRYHYDKEDRFQWVDRYAMEHTQLIRTTAGIPGSDANRISDALAFAGFSLYRHQWGPLTLTPGLRYENIVLSRQDYGSSDTLRQGSALTARSNEVRVWIPGIGLHYSLNQFALFGGVHRGFSPPGNQEGQLPEKSTNYELGTRFTHHRLNGEVTGFLNNYSNLLGSDFAATGGTGALDVFNAGEVRVWGMEMAIQYDFAAPSQKIALPLRLGYTFTASRFLTSFGSEEGMWGAVEAGDALPYIAPHQGFLTFGVNHKAFEFNVNGRYSSAFRTVAGRGAIPVHSGINANFILDASAKYRLFQELQLTCNVINLLNVTYAVARVPSGLRPGHPFGIYGGLALAF